MSWRQSFFAVKLCMLYWTPGAERNGGVGWDGMGWDGMEEGYLMGHARDCEGQSVQQISRLAVHEWKGFKAVNALEALMDPTLCFPPRSPHFHVPTQNPAFHIRTVTRTSRRSYMPSRAEAVS